MPPLNLDVLLANTQLRLALEGACAASLITVLCMASYFFRARMRKLLLLSTRGTHTDYKPNAVLLFLSYAFFTLLTFLITVAVAASPLIAIAYFVAWQMQLTTIFLPLAVTALLFGLLLGIYASYTFLQNRVIFEESKAANGM